MEWKRIPQEDDHPDEPPWGVSLLLAWKHWHSGEWVMEASPACWGDAHHGRNWHSDATHWMPLPSPPDATPESREG